MRRTLTLLGLCAVTMLAGCDFKVSVKSRPTTAAQAASAPAASGAHPETLLPVVEQERHPVHVAQITRTVNLVKVVDIETGVVCYMYDNADSPPNCVKVQQPTAVPAADQ